VFCAFPPRPGSRVGFNPATHAMLGAAFARDAARLVADLAAGAPVPAFRALLPEAPA
jgi:hypothetical protein